MFSFKGNDDFAPIPPPDLNNITMPNNTFSAWVFGVLDWTVGLFKLLAVLVLLAVPISAFLWAGSYQKRFGRPPTMQDWVQGWRDALAQTPAQMLDSMKQEMRRRAEQP